MARRGMNDPLGTGYGLNDVSLVEFVLATRATY